MSRSLKKGPFVDDSLMKKVEALNASGKKRSDQDLVQKINDLPCIRGTYLRRL